MRARIELLADTTGRSFSEVVGDAIAGPKHMFERKHTLHINSNGDTVEFDRAHCTMKMALSAYVSLLAVAGKENKHLEFTLTDESGQKRYAYDQKRGVTECTA